MSESAADQNLLFGVIALQCGLIEMQQFVDACMLLRKFREKSRFFGVAWSGHPQMDDKEEGGMI